MAVTLCVLLTAVPGHEHLLVEYEDQVLDLFAGHGARVLQRVRSLDVAQAPYEVQIIEFPSEAALEQYLQDPARAALIDLRDQAIASTEILRVAVV
jgi:uncharacterized protein (DUF1330 family)